MKNFRKIVSPFIALSLSVGLLVGCGATESDDTANEDPVETTAFESGTYTGEATGYGGKIIVDVNLTENKIKDITIVEHGETEMVSDPAIEGMPERILENQAVNVDLITTCTVSSAGVRAAVKDAIEKSGADMVNFEKEITEEDVAKEDEEKTADVIVVGGGGAGLSAAVSAYESGAESVILIEKMPALGGNTLIAGGAFNAVNPEKQEAQGIEDSIEKHFQQTYEGGHKVGDEELIHTLVDNALDAHDWLENHGLEWKDEMGQVIGALWDRSNQTVPTLGTGYITVLRDKAEEYGAEILLETEATDLITEDGKVVGVHAESPEKNYTFNANNGVIMATGGYANNIDMVRENLDDGVYTTDNLPEKISSTNAPGITGEGILMAGDVGADMIDMEHVQLLPMPGDKFGPSINIDDAFFINKEGERYVREDGGRDELCLATFEQTDGEYYMINDSKIIPEDRRTLSGENLDSLIEKGIVIEADSLEELAGMIDVPYETLQETADTFNSYVESGVDEDFGREVWGGTIDEAPYYATLRYPALHHTMGGLKINPNAEVLTADNTVIEGLYAAGEVTGGIHGANRLGGNAITDIMVFGKIAGQSVMKK